MKNTRFTAALLALTLGFGTIASAQPRHGHDGRDGHRGGPPHAHGGHPGGPKGGPQRGGPDRRYDNRGPDRHVDIRGAGPDHRWHRGDRLPVQYRSRQYVVDDWRGHRLSAPPLGYHWVQTGGDYVLVAIATGVIASLILSQ